MGRYLTSLCLVSLCKESISNIVQSEALRSAPVTVQSLVRLSYRTDAWLPSRKPCASPVLDPGIFWGEACCVVMAVIKLSMRAFVGDQPLDPLHRARAAQSQREVHSDTLPPTSTVNCVHHQGPVCSPRRQVHRLSNPVLEIIKDPLSLVEEGNGGLNGDNFHENRVGKQKAHGTILSLRQVTQDSKFNEP